MRVLVACEFSGRVRDAFSALGHDAWSCDLDDSEAPGPHIRGDVLGILGDGWDLMVAHPPCTHLAASGARWFARKQREQAAALDFVRALLGSTIPRVALENPKGVIGTRIRRADQTVQPWWFGDPMSKETLLWLRGLPRLVPTDVVDRGARLEYPGRPGYTYPAWISNMPHASRARERSRTPVGMARAMAAQWGGQA